MKIHLLGTAAAKPVPRIFCSCRGCTAARQEGGRSLRTRSSTSIYLGDDGPECVRYKVDLGPDANYHQIQFGECLNKLEHLLYTHAHMDHVHPYWLGLRRQAISAEEIVPLHIWANARVMELLDGIDFDAGRMTPHLIEPGGSFRAGELEVLPLAAMHPEVEPCINYAVTAEGKTVLLAWDTGYWDESTWHAAQHLRLDAVVMELTVNGPDAPPSGPYHHNADSFLRMKRRMEAQNMLNEGAPFVSTHMGDNGQLSHAEARRYWEPHGVTVGYDGLLIEL